MTGMLALLLGAGSSIELVQLPPAMLALDSQPDPVPSVAGVNIKSDGTFFVTGTGFDTWLLSGVNSDYEVRAHLNSGSITSGSALDTWHACTSDRFWQCDQTGPGNTSAELFIEIRLAGGAVLASSTATLSAEVF